MPMTFVMNPRKQNLFFYLDRIISRPNQELHILGYTTQCEAIRDESATLKYFVYDTCVCMPSVDVREYMRGAMMGLRLVIQEAMDKAVELDSCVISELEALQTYWQTYGAYGPPVKEPARSEKRAGLPIVKTVYAFKYEQIKSMVGADRRARNLQDLYDGLVTFKLVPDRAFKDFKLIFNGGEVSNPVKWLGTKGQLNIFVNALVGVKKANGPVRASAAGKWKTAISCFVGPKGELFTLESLARPGKRSTIQLEHQPEIERLAVLLLR